MNEPTPIPPELDTAPQHVEPTVAPPVSQGQSIQEIRDTLVSLGESQRALQASQVQLDAGQRRIDAMLSHIVDMLETPAREEAARQALESVRSQKRAETQVMMGGHLSG